MGSFCQLCVFDFAFAIVHKIMMRLITHHPVVAPMVAGILVIATGGFAHDSFIEPSISLSQTMEPIADIDFEGMFPGLNHHGFR